MIIDDIQVKTSVENGRIAVKAERVANACAKCGTAYTVVELEKSNEHNI